MGKPAWAATTIASCVTLSMFLTPSEPSLLHLQSERAYFPGPQWELFELTLAKPVGLHLVDTSCISFLNVADTNLVDHNNEFILLQL